MFSSTLDKENLVLDVNNLILTCLSIIGFTFRIDSNFEFWSIQLIVRLKFLDQILHEYNTCESTNSISNFHRIIKHTRMTKRIELNSIELL
jgi:hypothetical protein